MDPTAKNTARIGKAVKEVEESAERTTVLAANRTIFAALSIASRKNECNFVLYGLLSRGGARL